MDLVQIVYYMHQQYPNNDGATTIEIPVGSDNGSIFSILHTTIQLSYWSRTTSYSTFFQPLSDLWINNWDESTKTEVTTWIYSSRLSAKSDLQPSVGKAALNRTAIQENYSECVHTEQELDNEVVQLISVPKIDH